MKLKFRAELKDIVIFIIFCIFLLYIVAIGVINLSSFAIDGYFVGWNPFPAFGPDYIVATITFYIVALVAIIMSVSSFFIQREKGFGFTTKKKDDKDGYAKWLEEKDVKKLSDIKKINLKDEKYEAGGIPVLLGEKEAYVDNGENHSLIIGSTGSGKTQCVIFPMVRILAKAGESMILMDPKGEIYKGTGNLLKDQGYKVIVLNFREPEKGSRWNPFSLPYRFYKEGQVDKSMELLEDLGQNILIDPNNRQEPFWENSASDYFAGLSIGLFEDAKEEEININSINLMASVGEERLGASNYIKEYFLAKGELSPAYVSASSTINAPADTKGGIVSTFRTKTRIFSSREALSEMLSYSDFDFRSIGKEKTAVFLVIHDEKKTYHALATIFVKQAYESLIDVAFKEENGKLPVRTNFLLDEFANMPAVKDVDAMITASRSRNIRFNFIIQNFSQLNQTYGADMAETIRGNCGNLHFLLTTELKALEEISKLLGEAKPKKAKEGMPADPVRPLMTISDLQQMKQNEFVIKRWRTNPFKSKFKPDHELRKNNCWGKNYDQAEFELRTPGTLETFDLKEFVRKTKEARGEVMPPNMPAGGRGYMPPFSPFGAPPMAGQPMPGSPFGAPSPIAGTPITGVTPVSNAQGQTPMPQGTRPGGLNIDEFMKKLDAKIASLEQEEKAEKEKLATVANKVPLPSVQTKTKEDIDREIQNILNTKPTALGETSQQKITQEVTKIEKSEQNEQHSPELPKEEEIKKPKVNIDVDSIVVNNNITDEDFFDDFFGDEE